MRRRQWTFPGGRCRVVAAVALVVAAVALSRTEAGAPNTAASRPPAPALRCATPSHPHPVVLVAGTFGATDWTAMSQALGRRGYCVETFNYMNAGTGPIPQSASDLGRFVDSMRSRTGAERVSLVAHSEGGVVARYYVRFLGGARQVEDLVGLAPPNHGTTSPIVIPGATLGCIACAQQAAGSSLLHQLNTGGGIPGPVDYTSIETRGDDVVTPYRSAFLDGPANRITNVLLQDACPDDLASHLSITDDPVAVQWVENALARTGPADAAFMPGC
jgi:triacylglycerol esterase/lipase EstA (alpha/beta hydrolase family)